MSLRTEQMVVSDSTASGGRQSAVFSGRNSKAAVAFQSDSPGGLGRETRRHGGLTSAARCLLLVSALLVSAVSADDAKEGDKKNPPKEAAKAAQLKSVGELQPEQEAAALAFAGEHHPELKSLVESLKTANPDGYKKAIHDLSKTHERLGKLKANKASERYEHELALWKLESRIRLTAARSAMKDTDELRAELKALVEQRQALSLQWLKAERERTAARLTKLDAELLTAQPESVDAEVDRLLKSVKTKKPGVAASIKKTKTAKPKDTTP